MCNNISKDSKGEVIPEQGTAHTEQCPAHPDRDSRERPMAGTGMRERLLKTGRKRTRHKAWREDTPMEAQRRRRQSSTTTTQLPGSAPGTDGNEALQVPTLLRECMGILTWA